MKALKLSCLLLCMLYIQTAQCQFIASFSGTSTPLASSISGTNTIPFTRGPGIVVQNSTIYESKRWTNQNSIDLSDYIEWQLGTDTDFNLNLNSISIAYTTDNKAPRILELRVSEDNFNSFTVVFITSIPQNTEGIYTSPMNISLATESNLTFRLYGYNSTNSNSSKLGINGNLGTVLGLANTGISISGTLSYEGLYFDGANWIPFAPNNATGAENAFIAGGSPILNDNANINNLTITNGSGLIIPEGIGLTVNGNLLNDGNLELNSASSTYSSLIVNGTSIGEATYFRHVNQFAATGTSTGNNDLISAPLTSESLNFLALRTANPDIPSGTINGVPSFLYGPFNNNTNAYINYTTANDPDLIVPAAGYRSASIVPGGSRFRFDGNVITDNVSVAISRGSASIFNLIGNPFPSYISLDGFLAENNSKFDPLRSGVYGYDGDATDGFIIWNQAYADANPGALIAPGQGFLVASGQSLETIYFLTSMRTKGTADDFIPGRVVNPVIHIKHLKLKLEQNSNTYYTDLYFTDNASLGLDTGYDSALFNEVPGVAVYSQLVEGDQTDPLGVQSLNFNAYLDGVIVPLGINAIAGQQMTLTIDQSTLPEDTEVYLEDHISNSFTLLSTEDFVITPNSDLNGVGRYYLNFSNAPLSIDDPILTEIRITASSNPKIISINGAIEAETTLQIFDLQGRLINTVHITTQTRNFIIDASQFHTGVYIVSVANHNKTITEKVVIN